jgi:hypothetical protein
MKTELQKLDTHSLTNDLFGELIKRHLDDFNLLGKDKITDAPLKTYIAGLTSQYAAYLPALNAVQSNPLSKTVKAADILRDKSGRSLQKAMKVFTTSNDAPEAESAAVLLSLMVNFKEITNLDYERESINIDSLILKLESAEYAPHIARLSIGKFVTRLKTDNEAFKTLFTTRVSKADAALHYNVKKMRTDLSAYYKEFTLYVQALANIPNANKQFTQVLSLLNTARKYYADTLSHKVGVKEAKKNANKADTESSVL